jgi:AraC family transcriptional activator of pobA
MAKTNIPVYSIDKFKRKPSPFSQFQIELFDADRHFEVQYPHRHDFFEILFLTKGSGIHIIDFKEYEITENSLFFLSPGQIHSIEFSKDIEGYIFLFTPEFYLLNKQNKHKLLEFPFFYHLGENQSPIYLTQEVDITFLTDLFKKGCKEITLEDDNTSEMISALLDLVLLSSKRLYPKTENVSSTKSGHLLVKKFKQHIEENYQNNFSVADYASLLNITPSHLTETVKSLTGRTSGNFINDKIILEIKRLLLFSDLSATEIALELNFNDQSYFTKYFKKHTGVTPKQFRANS